MAMGSGQGGDPSSTYYVMASGSRGGTARGWELSKAGVVGRTPRTPSMDSVPWPNAWTHEHSCEPRSVGQGSLLQVTVILWRERRTFVTSVMHFG